MMLVHYKTKKELKENIGQPLRYTETSAFGPEYQENGSFPVAHRPKIQGNGGREFFAEVTMRNGLISAVK
tara:strand:- start:1004 stop:1213 length:210 start_codon:yes stop_codon:yes gene_type:complete